MAVHDRVGDVHESPIRRLVAEHEDSLRALGDGAGREGAFEVPVLGEASKDNVNRALPVGVAVEM